MQTDLTRNHSGANRTLGCVSIQGRTHGGIQFVAGKENGELLDFLAADDRLTVWLFAHNNPSSCKRNLRVARKSEFFTVSSLVPRPSPISPIFNPRQSSTSHTI